MVARDLHNHRHRQVDQPRGISRRKPVEERIWAKVEVHPLGCWSWTGSTSNGYGSIRDTEGRQRVVHRVAYEVWVGPIPHGLELDHLCRNRACVNPAHLEPVTHFVNAMRGGAGETKRRTHCLHGHAMTPDNIYIDQGKRRCRECILAKNRRAREKRKAAA